MRKLVAVRNPPAEQRIRNDNFRLRTHALAPRRHQHRRVRVEFTTGVLHRTPARHKIFIGIHKRGHQRTPRRMQQCIQVFRNGRIVLRHAFFQDPAQFLKFGPHFHIVIALGNGRRKRHFLFRNILALAPRLRRHAKILEPATVRRHVQHASRRTRNPFRKHRLDIRQFSDPLTKQRQKTIFGQIFYNSFHQIPSNFIMSRSNLHFNF